MSTETLERAEAVANDTVELDAENPEEYNEYYWEDYELCHGKLAEEILAEERDMMEHPEKYKVYTSVKEMFRDMGLDVSNLPDR